MKFRNAARHALFLGLMFFSLAYAQTPVSLAIHGPSTLYESTTSEYRVLVTWSDGTRSRASAAWSASWSGANAAFLSISASGTVAMLTVGNVSSGSTLTINATYSGPTGSLSASKSVSVLDASSFPAVTHTLVKRWNLLGNSIGAPLNVVATFGDPLQPVAGITDAVHSVWKWDSVNLRWAVFSPRLTPVQLVNFAAANGYSVLHVVGPGEGFWVNASQPLTLPARIAAKVSLSPGSVVSGWNMLSTGDSMTAGDLFTSVSQGLTCPGQQSLWAWHPSTLQWLFYSPCLFAAGGAQAVKTYTDANGYLDFTTMNFTLGHGIGFFVNTGTANGNSNLAPFGQAKAMFSELRTTVRAYSNDLKSGFLDAQSARVNNDLQNKVVPVLPWVFAQLQLTGEAVTLYEDVRNGVTSGYQQQTNLTTGKVFALRMFFKGSLNIRCVSNDMTAQVTAAQLTDVTCRSVNTDFDAWNYNYFASTPQRTQVIPFVTVSAGATSGDYNYTATKQTRLEQWTGTSWSRVGDTQIGAARSGALSRSYLPGTGNVSNITLTGNFPPRDPNADHDALSLVLARAVQDALTSVYRYSVTGTVASKTAQGVPMITLTLAGGSYYDAKEDANGNPLPNSPQSVHVVGTAETTASRFTGTLDLGAFAADADNAQYVPASAAFYGTFEDLSAGGAGQFLTGRFTVTLNNLATYHSLQPDSAGNFLSFDTAFVGTIQAPSRPEMRLTMGSLRASQNSFALTANYTYGAVSVTGVGTVDTLNTDNSTLTITNQDGVTVTFRPHADAVVSKGGVTLGTIPFGSSIVYFTDGYFESL